MQPGLTPSAREQECLLRVLESALLVRDAHAFFLWSQGQLQTLLPHALMVVLRFDADDALLDCEAVHACLLAPEVLARLCDEAGELARQWRAQGMQAALAASLPHAPEGSIGHVVLHGSGPAAGGATVFALFGAAPQADPRQAHWLGLLLPCLHLALGRWRAPHPAQGPRHGGTTRALSAREAAVLDCLREGHNNAQIGARLGISALTVKNHLRRIYPVLGARNRAEAVARCAALRLHRYPI